MRQMMSIASTADLSEAGLFRGRRSFFETSVLDPAACEQTHQFDMPETTIHMTCSNTAKAIEVRLTAGGDIKSRIIGEGEDDEPDQSE